MGFFLSQISIDSSTGNIVLPPEIHVFDFLAVTISSRNTRPYYFELFLSSNERSKIRCWLLHVERTSKREHDARMISWRENKRATCPKDVFWTFFVLRVGASRQWTMYRFCGNIMIVSVHTPRRSGTNLDAATIYRWAKVVPLAFSLRATPRRPPFYFEDFLKFIARHRQRSHRYTALIHWRHQFEHYGEALCSHGIAPPVVHLPCKYLNDLSSTVKVKIYHSILLLKFTSCWKSLALLRAIFTLSVWMEIFSQWKEFDRYDSTTVIS